MRERESYWCSLVRE